MLLVSWNVAGLKPALQRIRDDYGTGSDGKNGGGSANENERSKGGNGGGGGGASVSSSSSSPAGSSRTDHRHHQHPLARYLSLHGGVDVLCLQEHKIPRSQLSSRSEPLACSSVPGYESFWSCNDGGGGSDANGDKSTSSKAGFNGAVTYARAGLVRSADARPLRDPSLDSQGRCILTDHGSFVLFNVYVPTGGWGGRSLPNKMKFLNSLRSAMIRQRSEFGRKVVLVGDLNSKACPRDVHWRYRAVFIDRVLEQVRRRRRRQSENAAGSNGDSGGGDLPRWKIDVEEHWRRIEDALDTIEAVPRKTKNIYTGESFDKFVARMNLNPPAPAGAGKGEKSGTTGARYVVVGRPEGTAEEALSCYDFRGPSHHRDLETGEDVLCCKKNVVCLEILAELMTKVAGVEWTEATQRSIAAEGTRTKTRTDSSEGGGDVVENVGAGSDGCDADGGDGGSAADEDEDADENAVGMNPDSPSYQWMRKVLDDDGMVDAFRYFYPQAEGRATCWHQYAQKRYTNEGGRIDFTLVDASLLEHVRRGDVDSLRCGTSDPDRLQKAGDPLGEQAALLAATADGAFGGSTFAGGGIADAPRGALDTQFGAPHTGVIYTPPSYSDHVAVSLLWNDGGLAAAPGGNGGDDLVLDERGAATRGAQPHKRQRSISSFLRVGPVPAADGSSTVKDGQDRSSSAPSSSSCSRDKRSFSQLDAVRDKGGGDDRSKISMQSFFGSSNASTSSNVNKKAPPRFSGIAGANKSKANSSSSAKKAKESHKNEKKNSILSHFKRT